MAKGECWRKQRYGGRDSGQACLGSPFAPMLLSLAPDHPLVEPIPGSIGVVTGKFNLAELYEKIGYSKTILSKGKFAELLADNRAFTKVGGGAAARNKPSRAGAADEG